ncbi:hypothetical protein BS50DRAFT_643146 [Corynespora cassiicola Philippines]|uniref:Uncharacterized protein n=1 Tax=Corynespora cassiicola Philippines TaxID=1448308 RepID=A0A2T2PBE7_CORCC|nr:hypothetical protein BS50DRAFT_643146 [Corynespora cassiicola Philippines]
MSEQPTRRTTATMSSSPNRRISRFFRRRHHSSSTQAEPQDYANPESRSTGRHWFTSTATVEIDPNERRSPIHTERPQPRYSSTSSTSVSREPLWRRAPSHVPRHPHDEHERLQPREEDHVDASTPTAEEPNRPGSVQLLEENEWNDRGLENLVHNTGEWAQRRRKSYQKMHENQGL